MNRQTKVITSVFVLLGFLIFLQGAQTIGQALTATAEQKQTAQVLIVTGMDHPAHNWRETAPALKEVLQKDSRLQVRVIEDPFFLDSAAVERYDVIVVHFMNWEQAGPGTEAQAKLGEFVRGGRGLFILHFGCGAFQDWPEFRKIAGRVWDPKLRAHDPKGAFRVEINDVNHPITRGMMSFETDDELYTCLAGDWPIEVLAKARSKVDGKEYPMAFVLNYGKGRVFHCALGHDVMAVRNAGAAELFRRGCAWSAGLAVVPKAQGQKVGGK